MDTVMSLVSLSRQMTIYALLDIGDNTSAIFASQLTHFIEENHYTAVTLDILEKLLKQFPAKLSNTLLKALAPPHIRELNLKNCTGITNYGLQNVMKKCSKLSNLDLTGCNQLTMPHFFIPCYRQFTSLIVKESGSVTDHTVHTMIRCNPGLKKINISRCENITDSVFLVYEDTQLCMKAFQKHHNECQLSTVQLSGNPQLTSAAVRHLCTLCGPTLEHVNIQYTNIDCIALWYLSGYNLFTIIKMATKIHDDVLTEHIDGAQSSEGQGHGQGQGLVKDLTTDGDSSPQGAEGHQTLDTDFNESSVEVVSTSPFASCRCIDNSNDALKTNLPPVSIPPVSISPVTGPITCCSCCAKCVCPFGNSERCNCSHCERTVPLKKIHKVCENLKWCLEEYSPEYQEPDQRSQTANNKCDCKTCGLESLLEDCASLNMGIDKLYKLKDEVDVVDDVNVLVEDVLKYVQSQLQHVSTLDKQEHKIDASLMSTDKTTEKPVTNVPSSSDATYSECNGVNKPATDTNNDQLEQLYRPQLKCLSMQNMQFPSADMGEACLKALVKNNSGLEKLNISWGGLTDKHLAFIGFHCKQLQKISLVECCHPDITCLGLMKLAALCPHLKDIDLLGMNLMTVDAAIFILAQKCNLHHLNLGESPATDKALTYLADHCADTLKGLDISWCDDLTDEGLRYIVDRCTALETLILRQFPVSDLTIDLMASNCKYIKELNLNGQGSITDDSMVAIATNLSFLQILDVGWNTALTDHGARTVLIHCTQLVTLKMPGLGLHSSPFLPIISDIEKWRRCQSLLRVKLHESKVLNDDEHTSSDEEFDDLYLPHRSTSYAANLRRLELEYCDHVNDDHLAEIVAICRGTLVISNYYGDTVEPCWISCYRGQVFLTPK